MTLQKFFIEGGIPLEGTISVNGAKNAALPILAATLLTSGRSTIRNVPDLMDIDSIIELLRELGVSVERRPGGVVEVKVIDESAIEAPYDIVRKMRASVCVLGPLLAKRGKAKVSLPGGCNIGVRPIDLHLKGLRALGAAIDIEHGYVIAEAVRLTGTRIYLGGPFGSTVSGTENVMLASVLAEGKTVIDHAACEPEVKDLADFLNACGARIHGAGTPTVTVYGVPELKGADYTVIPDRIEAGTFIIAGALTGGDVMVENARCDHLSSLLDVLDAAGVECEVSDEGIRVTGDGTFRPVDVTANPYPGFPTDLQSQITVLFSLANEISIVQDKIYPDRFMHVAELNRMRANIRKEGNLVVIKAVDRLSGASVMASDLRASACLVLAGLVAQGGTEIRRIYHIDRGYERIEQRLEALGAHIMRVDEKADFALFNKIVPRSAPALKKKVWKELQI